MKKSILFSTIPFLMVAFLASIYLFTGCKKDVGVLNNIIKYDVSGSVLDSESAAVAGVSIILDGKAVATTDASGGYSLSGLLPGTYAILADKAGYTKGSLSLMVTEQGAVASVISIKKLTPAVTVPVSGATIATVNDLGATAATLTIPTGVITAPVQISVTPIVGNEALTTPEVQGKIPGASVEIDSSDPNITFPNGIKLTFLLPFTHQPGIKLTVQNYSGVTQKWETSEATVDADGETASVMIYHFSQYTCLVDVTFTQQDFSSLAPVVVPFEKKIKWQSMMDFKTGVPSGLDVSFLLGTAESATNLVFSSYKNGSTLVTHGNKKNQLDITPASTSNPEGFGNLDNRPWELVKYNYNMKGIYDYKVWDKSTNKNVTKSLTGYYEMPSYVWLWRPSESFAIPATVSFSHEVVSQVNTLVIGTQHSGGSGN
jgi:hypothetical protein